MKDGLRLVDRSRTISYQNCPRRRFLEYEYDGIGLRKIRANIPLFIGSCVHSGLAQLLLGVDTDEAVSIALAEYDSELKRRGLELEAGEDPSYVASESKAQIEALVRVYALRALPELLQRYEVLEVEREDLWRDFAPGIGWMSRADGLLLEKETQDLYVLSFKTAAQWDSRTDRQNTHDVQGLSEVAAIEARLASDWRYLQSESSETRVIPIGDRTLEYLRSLDAPPRILGVKMVYLIKGRREQYPEDSGQWITSSHLLRGWMREGITGQEFAWRFKWAGPDTWPDSGRLKGHTLGKGWTRFNTWEAEGGVKTWLELLETGTVQPDAGDPFAACIVEPQPYYRQQSDLENWAEQTAAQETRIAADAAYCESVRVNGSADDLRHALNTRFPQNRHSCDYPSPCQMIGICWGDSSMLQNPLGLGLYERRESHHAPEREKVSSGAK
jgi:hypothetical protein